MISIWYYPSDTPQSCRPPSPLSLAWILTPQQTPVLLSDLHKEQIPKTPGLEHSTFYPQIKTEKTSPIYAAQKKRLPNAQEAPKKGLYLSYFHIPKEVWMSVCRFPSLLVMHSQAGKWVSQICTEMCQKVSILVLVRNLNCLILPSSIF